MIENLTQLITVEDAPAVFSLLEDRRAMFETDKMRGVFSSNNPIKLALLRACNQVRSRGGLSDRRCTSGLPMGCQRWCG